MDKETIAVARAALDYIDALPKDVVASLPAMPGFDRDWAENVLAAVEPPPMAGNQFPRTERVHLRDKATTLLEQAEATLLALADSYTEERDGKFSACHPKTGIANTHQQLMRLRKSLVRAKI